MKTIVTAAFALFAFTSASEAAPHRHYRQHVVGHDEGRPAHCVGPHGRRIPWCGCWLATRHGMNDRSLWLARNWARVGTALSGPVEHAIGVMGHHVFEVLKVIDAHTVLAISGNDSRAVRTRLRSTAGVIAWRMLNGDGPTFAQKPTKATRVASHTKAVPEVLIGRIDSI